MGINVDQLKSGLQDYNQSLDSHINRLREDFESLMDGYYSLKQEYEGQAAEEFKYSWERTASWFEEYIDNAINLSQMLEDRIESLSKA